MQSIEGAVIACAGLGSRLGMGLPKCMIEVDGQTILSRLVRALRPHVPRIHIVVGYREDIVTEYCSRYYRDVVLVRNPDFRSTNTAHSLRLGSVGFSNKVLYLDGDLIINEESLTRFIENSVKTRFLIGITPAKSSQAVFVSTQQNENGDSIELKAFHRSPSAKYEWANVFSGPPNILRDGSGYVFESLQSILPARAQELQLFEVDTSEDLERAIAGLSVKK
jgi:choline kinase